jgi:two-component system, OmpR family, response regulator
MKNSDHINLFIVEDNHVFAMALKANVETTFKNKTINIHSFESGEACIERLKVKQPHVVILDYNLDSKNDNAMNGIQVLDRVKKINPDIHVVMLTSNDHIDIALKSFNHGASDYVVKTETQFTKINYAIFNILKIMEVKKTLKNSQLMVVLILIFVALLIGVVATIQILAPSIFE